MIAQKDHQWSLVLYLKGGLLQFLPYVYAGCVFKVWFLEPHASHSVVPDLIDALLLS